MAALSKRAGGVLLSDATFVPTNGLNTIVLSIEARDVDEDWLEVTAQADGPSITGCGYIGLTADKTGLILSVEQSGTDTLTVQAWMRHSLMR